MGLNLAAAGTPNGTGNQPAGGDLHPTAGLRRPARILVVDDEAQVRSMIGVTLERKGYDVQLAANSREAIEMLGRNAFDLVLTDILMQEGDGIALLDNLRCQQPHLPVVMVSAIHDISVAIDAMRRGAYDYLLKPFERDHLLQIVKRALDYRQALQESHSYQQNLEHVVRARTEMLHQAMEELEHSYDVTLEALGDALDLKDSETEGHSKRVTAYTIALARAMGIAPAEIKVIARGAFLHDIGKMAIPDEILRKPGKLNAEEQEVMREHCTRGYQILRKIPFLAEAAEIVYSHQEHYDGSGYPRRAAGRRDSHRRPHLRRRRHSGRHHQRPALSQGAQLQCGARRDFALLGNAVRPGRGRGSFWRFPTSFGTSCDRRLPARTSAFPPSTWPLPPLPPRSSALDSIPGEEQCPHSPLPILPPACTPFPRGNWRPANWCEPSRLRIFAPHCAL